MTVRYGEIFGEDRENAPPRQYVDPMTPVFVHLPDEDGDWNRTERLTHKEALKLHHDLGQTLARMMRKRGSSTPPGGDVGGTPAALQLKEAA